MNKQSELQTIRQLWEQKFYECLALEFNDPAYFRVHHLLVFAYMLQTDTYQDDYVPLVVSSIKGFLNGAAIETFRKKFDAIPKNGKITKSPGSQNIFRYKWDLDILSVDTGNADIYAKTVHKWAKNVVECFGVLHTSEAPVKGAS